MAQIFLHQLQEMHKILVYVCGMGTLGWGRGALGCRRGSCWSGRSTHLYCKNASSLHPVHTMYLLWISVGDIISFVKTRVLVFGRNICACELTCNNSVGRVGWFIPHLSQIKLQRMELLKPVIIAREAQTPIK